MTTKIIDWRQLYTRAEVCQQSDAAATCIDLVTRSPVTCERKSRDPDRYPGGKDCLYRRSPMALSWQIDLIIRRKPDCERNRRRGSPVKKITFCLFWLKRAQGARRYNCDLDQRPPSRLPGPG